MDEFDAHGCKKSGSSEIEMTRTEIFGRDYLEFSYDKKGISASERLVIFVAYRFDSNNHFIVSGPDLNLFQHATQVGAIQGVVTYPKDRDGKRLFPNEGPDIHITDSTAHLRAYLEAHPEAMKESNEPPQPLKLDKVPTMDCRQ